MASEHRLQENGRSPVPLSPYTQTRYYRKNFSFILNFISVNYSYLTWEPDSQTWCYGHIGLASLQLGWLGLKGDALIIYNCNCTMYISYYFMVIILFCPSNVYVYHWYTGCLNNKYLSGFLGKAGSYFPKTFLNYKHYLYPPQLKKKYNSNSYIAKKLQAGNFYTSVFGIFRKDWTKFSKTIFEF